MLLTEDEPSALLSVWSAGDSDVWAVGGDDRAESEQGPLVLHRDGTGWRRLDAGVRDVDLWWVFGFAGGPVFLGAIYFTDTGNHLRPQDRHVADHRDGGRAGRHTWVLG